jgi:hypothetical protein
MLEIVICLKKVSKKKVSTDFADYADSCLLVDEDAHAQQKNLCNLRNLWIPPLSSFSTLSL